MPRNCRCPTETWREDGGNRAQASNHWWYIDQRTAAGCLSASGFAVFLHHGLRIPALNGIMPNPILNGKTSPPRGRP
jgi:hypothetical protein